MKMNFSFYAFPILAVLLLFGLGPLAGQETGQGHGPELSQHKVAYDLLVCDMPVLSALPTEPVPGACSLCHDAAAKSLTEQPGCDVRQTMIAKSPFRPRDGLQRFDTLLKAVAPGAIERTQKRTPVLFAQVDSDGSDNGGFFKQHWGKILLTLILVAEAITRWTPTEKDNSILNWIKALLDQYLPNARASGGVHT